jgi:hypothetical protein
MKRTIRLILGLALSAGAAMPPLPAGAARLAVPILVGGDDYDACSSVGMVRGLKASGDGFLAVRAGPGTRHAMLDKLHNGDLVYICDERSGWYGVVYERGGRDCNVSRPWPLRHEYTGPCPAGWVHGNWVEVVAG